MEQITRGEMIRLLRDLASYGESGKVPEPYMVDRAHKYIETLQAAEPVATLNSARCFSSEDANRIMRLDPGTELFLLSCPPAPAAVPDEAFNLIEAIRAELTWPGWRKTSSRDWVMDRISELLSMLTTYPATEHSGDGNEMVGWNSVSNPPATSGEYLVIYSGAVLVAEYKSMRNRWIVGAGVECDELEELSHWMPLPEPPQQEEAER